MPPSAARGATKAERQKQSRRKHEGGFDGSKRIEAVQQGGNNPRRRQEPEPAKDDGSGTKAPTTVTTQDAARDREHARLEARALPRAGAVEGDKRPAAETTPMTPGQRCRQTWRRAPRRRRSRDATCGDRETNATRGVTAGERERRGGRQEPSCAEGRQGEEKSNARDRQAAGVRTRKGGSTTDGRRGDQEDDIGEARSTKQQRTRTAESMPGARAAGRSRADKRTRGGGQRGPRARDQHRSQNDDRKDGTEPSGCRQQRGCSETGKQRRSARGQSTAQPATRCLRERRREEAAPHRSAAEGGHTLRRKRDAGGRSRGQTHGE